MMNSSNRNLLRRAAVLPLGLALAAPALAGFTNPYTPPYRGAPDTEFAGWESFSSAYLGANAPDHPSSTSDDALIYQTTPNAFLTGGNIYSFNSVSTFELHNTVVGDVQQVALQTSTKANELDYANVRLRYIDSLGVSHDVAFDSFTQLAHNSGPMGVEAEALFEWDLSGVSEHVTTFVLLFDASDISVSLDAVLLDVRWSPAPSTYCTAQTNSQGCTPAIAFTGVPSASAGSGFAINASQILDHKSGIFFYGTGGAAALPHHGGLLCVAAPLRRTPVQNSGGTNNCTGSYSYDFNARIASGIDSELVAGTQVWGQYWSRDPLSTPAHTNLTDAITFVIGQ